MKKLFLTAVVLLTITSFAHAGKNLGFKIPTYQTADDSKHIPLSQVPAAVRSSFNERYPNARNVQWEREREDGKVVYHADFNLGNRQLRAFFAPNGNFLGQERH